MSWLTKPSVPDGPEPKRPGAARRGPAVEPTGATMACALAMGVTGAPAGLGDPLGRPVPAAGLLLNRVLVTAMLGLLIGLTAMEYQLISAHSLTQVLFSGQEALPELVDHAADYSVALWR